MAERCGMLKVIYWALVYKWNCAEVLHGESFLPGIGAHPCCLVGKSGLTANRESFNAPLVHVFFFEGRALGAFGIFVKVFSAGVFITNGKVNPI